MHPVISFFQSHRQNVLLMALLVLITFVSFGPVLKAQFLIWDGDTYITSNPNILNFDVVHLKAIWKERINGIYQPLTTLSFSVEHMFFGFNPSAYHFDNLLLHIAVVLLVFFFGRSLRLTPLEAFLGALLFAIHPMKVESVAWLTERKDILCAFFYMLALLSYQGGRIVLCFILGMCGMLASPMAISLPLILILLDWYNSVTAPESCAKRFDLQNVISKWPFVLMVAVIGWQTYTVYSSGPVSHGAQTPLIWIWTFIFYIKKFLVPLDFLPIYDLPRPISLWTVHYALAVVTFIGVMIGVWRLRKNKLVLFSFLFYVFTMFFWFRIDIADGINIVADRLLYIGSIGFCFLFARTIFWIFTFLKSQEPFIRHLFSTALIVLALGLMMIVYNQSHIWRDSVSLWRYQIRLSPHPVAFNNLAKSLRSTTAYALEEQDYPNAQDKTQFSKVQEVIDLYKQAINLDGKQTIPYYNLANVYRNIKRYDQALIWYNKALSIDDKDINVLFALGVMYEQSNNPKGVVDTYKKLLKAYPDNEFVHINIVDAYTKAIELHPTVKLYQEQREEVLSEYEQFIKRKKYTAVDYFNLGFLYEQVGGYEEAIRFYKKSLELNPKYDKALYNLANRFQEMGDMKTALVLYERLVHFHPHYALGYLNMGGIYNALGDVSRARMLYQKTIDVDPNNAGAYFNLGLLSQTAGDLKEALNYYEKAVEKDSSLAEGYFTIGNIYAAMGQTPEAIASYLKTISLNKSHLDAYVNLSILSFKSRDFEGAIGYLEEAQLLGYTPPEEYLKSLEPYRKK